MIETELNGGPRKGAAGLGRYEPFSTDYEQGTDSLGCVSSFEAALVSARAELARNAADRVTIYDLKLGFAIYRITI